MIIEWSTAIANSRLLPAMHCSHHCSLSHCSHALSPDQGQRCFCMLFTAMSSHVLIVFLLYMLKRRRFLLMWCHQLNLTPLNHLWKTIVVHIHHALPQVQRAISGSDQFQNDPTAAIPYQESSTLQSQEASVSSINLKLQATRGPQAKRGSGVR